MDQDGPENPIEITPEITPASQARRVLRAARAGTLATAEEGQPFASLVTPATVADGDVLHFRFNN